MKPLAPIAPTSMPDLDLVVEQLCAPSSLETVLHHPLHDSPMPSLEELGEIMSRLKATLFPGYFGVSCVHVESTPNGAAAWRRFSPGAKPPETPSPGDGKCCSRRPGWRKNQ